MAKPRISSRPPQLTALAGRASPKGSKNYGGLNKGIDMPNKTKKAPPNMAPFGGGGMPPAFRKGGKA